VPNRTALALHCLDLAGFETYEPRLREQRQLVLLHLLGSQQRVELARSAIEPVETA